MANRRAETQKMHERAVVADFLRWYRKRRKVAFEVVAEPEPPEAIIQSKSKRLTRWVEVVDAFWSPQWARDQYSYATPGEIHAPVGSGPHVEPDATFASNFVSALSKKLRKQSYEPFAKQYGPGYLIVNVDYPLFTGETLHRIRQVWSDGRPWDDNGYFREVFLRIRGMNGYSIKRWVL